MFIVIEGYESSKGLRTSRILTQSNVQTFAICLFFITHERIKVNQNSTFHLFQDTIHDAISLFKFSLFNLKWNEYWLPHRVSQHFATWLLILLLNEDLSLSHLLYLEHFYLLIDLVVQYKDHACTLNVSSFQDTIKKILGFNYLFNPNPRSNGDGASGCFFFVVVVPFDLNACKPVLGFSSWKMEMTA
jgi:hypothetical protein